MLLLFGDLAGREANGAPISKRLAWIFEHKLPLIKPIEFVANAAASCTPASELSALSATRTHTRARVDRPPPRTAHP